MWVRSLALMIAIFIASCGSEDVAENFTSADIKLYNKIKVMNGQNKLNFCRELQSERKASLFFLTMRGHHGDYSLDGCFADGGLNFVRYLRGVVVSRGEEDDVLHLIVVVSLMKKKGMIDQEGIVRLKLEDICRIKAPHGLSSCYEMLHGIDSSHGDGKVWSRVGKTNNE